MGKYTILAIDQDEGKKIAEEALIEAIRLCCQGLTNNDVVSAADAALVAVAGFIAPQIKSGLVPHNTADAMAERLRSLIVRHWEMRERIGAYSPEAIAELETLSMGLPISGTRMQEFREAGFLTDDNKVKPEALEAVRAWHNSRQETEA